MRSAEASVSEVAGDRIGSPAARAKERVRRFAFGFTNLPLSWWELFTRTTKEFVADNSLGLAAQLAYYFFFALFPAVLVGLAFASFFPLEHFVDRIVGALGGIVPATSSGSFRIRSGRSRRATTGGSWPSGSSPLSGAARRPSWGSSTP